ncbi:GrpB family protein [Aquincola sp. S2]|uniref:GrpB family protein n=1 Tax=Pseudaquabacterium terrae TaxID=2732868 RepID=A0ABX2EFW0_9BURK|nr:GrpB family protein [Aquabacterium terrae]
MTAPVEVVPYCPEWPARFEAEKRVLQSALSPWLVGEIQHVGSTAVVGLPAKPVIDIMAPVASLPESAAAIAAAALAGYVHHPYRAEVMHWFCKPSPHFRTHHLHLVPVGSQQWLECLAFRDALRANQALRDEYARLKLRLAAQFPHDREAYTQAKAPFMQRVLSNA